MNDTLPGTLLDPSSIIFDTSFQCESGQVVVDDQCVPCPPGTYFDEAEQVCTKCARGFYNPDFAQRACTKCPSINGAVDGVTETEGATSASDCKERCGAGTYYDQVTGLCRHCGFGRYQPEEGRATKPIYKKRTTPVETKPESVATKSESSVARDGSETTVDIETVKVKTVKRIFLNPFCI